MKIYKYQIYGRSPDGVWSPINGEFDNYNKCVENAKQMAVIRNLKAENIRIWRIETEKIEENWRLNNG